MSIKLGCVGGKVRAWGREREERERGEFIRLVYMLRVKPSKTSCLLMLGIC